MKRYEAPISIASLLWDDPLWGSDGGAGVLPEETVPETTAG